MWANAELTPLAAVSNLSIWRGFDRSPAAVTEGLTMLTAPRMRIAALVLVGFAALSIACSGGDEERPTIRAAGFNFSESHVLAWIFAIAFQDAGFDVDTSQIQPGSTREILKPALEDNEIDYLPEYTGTLLAFLGGQPTGDSQSNYEAARELYAPGDVTLLPYAPAQNRNAFTVTREFSEARGVTTLSDLAPIADELRLGAPAECPQRPFCAIGLREVYGIEFDRFIPIDTRATAGALAAGDVEVVLLFSTDAPLAVNDFVVLEDDLGMLAAENIALAIRTEIVDAYGEELPALVAAISAQITNEELSELNRQVQVDGLDAEAAARGWLAARAFLVNQD